MESDEQRGGQEDMQQGGKADDMIRGDTRQEGGKKEGMRDERGMC